jgi:hypothetical protein
MIDPGRLDAMFVQRGPTDVAINLAIVRNYFTGEPVAACLALSAEALVTVTSDGAFAARYYPEARSVLDELYQALLDYDALLVIGFHRDGERRYVITYMTPGGLRVRVPWNAAEPIAPLTDLAVLGELNDALLCGHSRSHSSSVEPMS